MKNMKQRRRSWWDNAGHGESSTKRGRTPEYQAWIDMKARCCRSSHADYPNYGKRGIKVCDRWMHSFQTFLADVGRKPSSEHSLDRFPNNDGNYEPGNVRWATSKQQANNRRAPMSDRRVKVSS